MAPQEIKQNVLVSVVICTYNGVQFIEEQLASICKQTYENLEIIISDDFSTDGTWEFLEKYSELDPRVILNRNRTNLGFTGNFNRAIDLTRGEVIAFADQDDIWHEQKISQLMNHWPETCPLIYCHSERFSDNIKDWNVRKHKSYRRFEGTDGRKISVFNTISGHALMLRRSLISKVFPVCNGISYDWYAGFVASCNGGVCYYPKTLVLQRVHSQNATIEEGYEYRHKQDNLKFKKLVGRHLKAFLQVSGLSSQHREFIKELSVLWDSAIQKPFSKPLLMFCIRHQKIIFWNKRKIGGIISRLKYSWRLAHNKCLY